ncbi:MAG: AI-2E family transporter, partial [Gemmatimonadota bacterium]
MRDFSGTFTPLGRMLLAMACAVVVLAGMRAASSVIGPIVIALLITVAWSPGSDWLRRRGWNPTVAALTGIVLGVVVVVLIGVLAWSSLAQLQERLPAYQPQMEALWLSVSGLLAQLPFDTSRLTSLSALQPQSLVGWAVAAVRRVTAATGGKILLLLIMAVKMIEAPRYPAKLPDALA